MIRWMFCLLLLAWPAGAQEVPARLGWLGDYAAVLTQDEAARIEAALETGRRETGIEVAVAVIPSRRDHGGPAGLEDFATGWFNAWGLGDAQRNDGILILIARDDRELRIALGSGYPPEAEAAAQTVVDRTILPALRDGRLAEGIEAGVIQTYDRIARPFATGQGIVPEAEGSDAPLVLLFLGVMAGGVLWQSRRRLGDRAVRWRRCPACGQRALSRHREVALAPGERMEEHTTCAACGDDRVRLLPIPSRSASRSRSSGGSGGGRSSGGGASGRW